MRGRFCKDCFAKVTNEGRTATLAAEVEEEKAKRLQIVKPTGREPALQLLVLPCQIGAKLPDYAGEASYLDPVHCRKCMERVGEEAGSLHTSGASDRSSTRAIGSRGCVDSAQMDVDIDTQSGKNVDKRSYLHPDVAKHVQEAHGQTPQAYREEVFSDAFARWPEAVSPQVLRTRLAAYKQHLTQENWTFGVCASCARLKRQVRLQSVVFPAAECEAAPAWLGWKDLEWLQFRAEWWKTLNEIFSTGSYLQKYFEADARVRNAEQELLDMQQGARHQDGFRSTAEAERWCRRVRTWRNNMKNALEEDSVQAPGRVDVRWLLYIPSLLGLRQGEPAEGISCHLCHKCASSLKKRDAKDTPRPEAPYYARARGMWGGPEPQVIKDLTFVERRVTQLARAYTLLKRVLGKHVPWAKGNLAAIPQYTTANTVAYPNNPAEVTRAICLLPADLCKDMAVQFVSNLADAFQEPALQVSVYRLRDVIGWYAVNCWPWMEQTKFLGVENAQDLGEYLEHVLALYHESVGSSGEGIPRELLCPATKIDEAHGPQGREGPVDAAAGSESDAEPAPKDEVSGVKRMAPVFDYSSAVLDTGLEDLTPLELWATAMRKYRVLDECSSILESLGAKGEANEREQALRDETMAIAEAAQALQRLANREQYRKMRDYVNYEREDTQRTTVDDQTQANLPPGKRAKRELHTFWEQSAQGQTLLEIRHKPELLNSFDSEFWAHCFVDLFFRGDCREKYVQHSPQLGGKRWIKVLLKRVDFRGWSHSKEFAACVYNILLRREQMRAVFRYVQTNSVFRKNLVHFDSLTAVDFVKAALASGDCTSVRDYMRKRNVDIKVKAVLRSMDVALRDIEGSEAERDGFRYKFFAMRVWSGCSVLFLTINPHDINSPMLVVFANADEIHLERISLDWNDEEMASYYKRSKQDNALRFHEFAVKFPAAAAECVHMAFRMAIEVLFNCAPPGNVRPERQHADGFPCKCEPGIFNFIMSYLGIVEPQMRWTEHLHMLLQLMGFAHPQDFFRGRAFADAFRSVWKFVSSIVFESQEAFANYLGTSSAMDTLRKLPVMPVRAKQKRMMGAERWHTCIDAQLHARGLREPSSSEPASEDKFPTWTPGIYASTGASAADWASFAVQDSNSGSQACGNHVCRSSVCHKGRLGKAGFCRLLHWHFEESMGGPQCSLIVKRVHGKELQSRWDGEGLPPIHYKPPHKGAFRLERNHGWHFKMTPGPMLALRCNHDLGILLKLPVLGNADRKLPVTRSALCLGTDRSATCAAGSLAERVSATRKSLNEGDSLSTGRLHTVKPHPLLQSGASSLYRDVDQSAVIVPEFAVEGDTMSLDQGCEGTNQLSIDDGVSKLLDAWMQDAAYAELPPNKFLKSMGDHVDRAGVDTAKWYGAVAEMMETIIDHEFYCHDYASKEQPHAQGLLHTLYDSMVRARRFENRRLQDGASTPPVDVFDSARRLLQRLVAATNRRFHKGVPSVYAYLLGKPNHYASHEFVKYSFGQLYNTLLGKVFKLFQIETLADESTLAVDEVINAEPVVEKDASKCAASEVIDAEPVVEKDASKCAARVPVSKSPRPTHICWDYQWRPNIFKDFSLYFFQAATDIRTSPLSDGTYLWYEEPTSAARDPWDGKHPCYKEGYQNDRLWMRSRCTKDKKGNYEPLIDEETKHRMCRYDHYRELRLHKPWRVPVLFGKMPATPTSTSSSEERGRYAVFMMMLFRPWRHLEQTVLKDWMGDSVLTHIDAAWEALFTEFLRWRKEDIIDVASPYFNRAAPFQERSLRPLFEKDGSDWWPCLIYPRLLNMELALARKRRNKDTSLNPIVLGVRVENDEAGSPTPPCSPRGSDSDDAGIIEDDTPADELKSLEDLPRGVYPPVSGKLCGSIGHAVALNDFFGAPANLGRRSAESRYSGEFARRIKDTGLALNGPGAGDNAPVLEDSTERFWVHWSASAVSALAPSQSAYLMQLDADLLADPSSRKDGTTIDLETAQDPMAQMKDKINKAIVELRQASGQRQPSHAVVLEAACFLLQRGLLNVKQTGRVNVKQGCALLTVACCLQHRKSLEWIAEGILGQDALLSTAPLLRDLELIITGAAGTGKTTTIMVIEALMDFFYEPGALPKSAPTITASRLLGGNTSHALYKLPRGTLHGKRGKLSATVLRAFRKLWAKARGHVIDEISVFPPGSFYQLEVRSRTAKEKPMLRFGGLLTIISGDFLQLPPVDVPSLAIPWDDLQEMRREAAESDAIRLSKHDSARKEQREANHRSKKDMVSKEQQDAEHRFKKEAVKKEQQMAEHRGGCELWASIRTVVSLTLNMRSSGPLARILQEMRAGNISDEAWKTLQERVLGVRRVGGKLQALPDGEIDPRLTTPPFSDHDIHYVLHRHVLRVSQTYTNALHESVAAQRRLYVIVAADAVKKEDEGLFTEDERLRALQIANLRNTQQLPGHLAIYVGIHVLVFGKLCVRLGLMNGCECVVERLILANEEPDFQDFLAGMPTMLEYMPAGIALRAMGADWTLPTYMLPPLPKGYDRRGLFYLTPSTDYFPMLSAQGKKIQIKRTQFTLVSASARVVWSAQGESWHAVVGDLACPPGMSSEVFWLACYVILSRAFSLEGLLLLRLATRAQLSTGAPSYLVKALDRLLELERQTTTKVREHLQQFKQILPPEILALFDDGAPAEEEEAFRLASVAASGAQASSEGYVGAAILSDIMRETDDSGLPTQVPAGSAFAIPSGWDSHTTAVTGDSCSVAQSDAVAEEATLRESTAIGVDVTLTSRSYRTIEIAACAKDVDGNFDPQVEAHISLTTPSPQVSLEFRPPYFEMHVATPPAAITAPIRWTHHRAHIAAFGQFLQNIRLLDLEAEILRRRSEMERVGFQCTLVEDLCAKTVSVGGPSQTCGQGGSESRADAGSHLGDDPGSVPITVDSVVSQDLALETVVESLPAATTTDTLPYFLRFFKKHCSASAAATGTKDTMDAGSSAPAHALAPSVSGVVFANSAVPVQMNSDTAGARRAEDVSEERPRENSVLDLNPSRPDPNNPRNSLLLAPPAQDVSALLGYEDGTFDYVDYVSGALRNLGNTCYLNAILHVLARVPSVRRWCARHQVRFAQESDHPNDCLLCALAFDLSHLAVDLGGVPTAPKIAQRRAAWSHGAFDDYLQHDAHEAFGILMEGCEQVDANVACLLGLPELARNGHVNSCRYSTPFWKAFGGILRSEVMCHACGYAESQYEMWHCLSIALPREPVTIEQLLSNHWGTEPLRGEDDKCEQRGCLVPHRRSQETRLVRWPNILAIHLKRWEVVSMMPFLQEKVYTRVAFENVLPVDTERPPYHLRGVVVHEGGAGVGHYTAFVRAPDNFWYFCNDGHAPRLARIDEVLEVEAYILFYEQ